MVSEGLKPAGASVMRHPIELYLKAHFVNKRLYSIEKSSDSGLLLSFSPENQHTLLFDFSKDKRLQITCKVADRKPFRSELFLAQLNEDKSLEDTPSAQPRRESKHQKLLENVQADIADAQHALNCLSPLLRILREDPAHWLRREEWPDEQRVFIADWIKRRKLSFSQEKIDKATVDKLYDFHRRMKRKLTMAGDRLERLEAQGPSDRALERSSSGKSVSINAKGPRRKGLKVELSLGMIAILGRSAAENDELLRSAASHDLWFHVRGQRGAHVWVPRGQKGFARNDKLNALVLNEAAQLAVINSKARKSASATVDYTEKRYLKKLKGQEGAVKILRSETVFAKIDPEFEKRIMSGI